MKNGRSFSDVLAKMQGGINWKVLEEGIELEIDMNLFLQIKRSSPDAVYLEIEIGADKIGIKTLKKDFEKGKVKIRLQFVK